MENSGSCSWINDAIMLILHSLETHNRCFKSSMNVSRIRLLMRLWWQGWLKGSQLVKEPWDSRDGVREKKQNTSTVWKKNEWVKKKNIQQVETMS